MTEHFILRPLEPTREDAAGARLLILQDMLAMGVPEEEALKIANPDDEGNIKQQIDWIEGKEEKKKLRLGAFAAQRPGQMLGLLVTGDWALGDELRYIDGAEGMSMYQKALMRHRLKNIIGMYAFAANRFVDEELQAAVRTDMLATVIDRADDEQRKVKSSFYEADPASDLLFANGFRIQEGREGVPIGESVRQKLIVRDPQPRSGLDAFIESQHS